MIPRIVTLDLETTGLQPLLNRAIEVAAVRWIDGRPAEHFHTLVHPGEPIDPASTAIHGITDADVADAPPMETVLPRLLAFLGGDPIAAHNAPFDLAFLTVAALTAGLRLPAFDLVDTLPLSRAAFPELPSHRLTSLSAALELGGTEFHRALADAETAGRLLFRCLDALEARRAARETLAPTVLAENPAGYGPAGTATVETGAEDPLGKFRVRFDPHAEVPIPRKLRNLGRGLAEGRDVVVHYPTATGGVFPREVTPRDVVHLMGRNYLRAVCLQTREERTYRLDRIRRVDLVPQGSSLRLPF